MIRVLPISAKQARETIDSTDWLSTMEAYYVFEDIKIQAMQKYDYCTFKNLSDIGKQALRNLGYVVEKDEFIPNTTLNLFEIRIPSQEELNK